MLAYGVLVIESPALVRIAEGPADFSYYLLAARARNAGYSAVLTLDRKGGQDGDASFVEVSACSSATLQPRSDCQDTKGCEVAQKPPPPSFPRRRESIVMPPRIPARRSGGADSVLRLRAAQQRGPIVVHGLPETLQALRDHVFNGVI